MPAGPARLAGLRVGRGQDLPGVHAGPDLHLDSEALSELVVHSFEPSLHAQRGSKGSGGIVLVRDRDAEHGHDRVPDELLDSPALGLDLLAHRGEVGAHYILETFGVQALAECGRTGDVREQDRDQAALLTRRHRLRLQLGTARWAEARPSWDLCAADGTGGNHGGSARDAEARFVLVDGSAVGARSHGGESTSGPRPRGLP